MTELPKLPPAAYGRSQVPSPAGMTPEPLFMDIQMRAYGAECYRKGIEDAARLVDERHDPCEPWLTGDEVRGMNRG